MFRAGGPYTHRDFSAVAAHAAGADDADFLFIGQFFCAAFPVEHQRGVFKVKQLLRIVAVVHRQQPRAKLTGAIKLALRPGGVVGGAYFREALFAEDLLSDVCFCRIPELARLGPAQKEFRERGGVGVDAV